MPEGFGQFVWEVLGADCKRLGDKFLGRCEKYSVGNPCKLPGGLGKFLGEFSEIIDPRTVTDPEGPGDLSWANRVGFPEVPSGLLDADVSRTRMQGKYPEGVGQALHKAFALCVRAPQSSPQRQAAEEVTLTGDEARNMADTSAASRPPPPTSHLRHQPLSA